MTSEGGMFFFFEVLDYIGGLLCVRVSWQIFIFPTVECTVGSGGMCVPCLTQVSDGGCLCFYQLLSADTLPVLSTFTPITVRGQGSQGLSYKLNVKMSRKV